MLRLWVLATLSNIEPGSTIAFFWQQERRAKTTLNFSLLPALFRIFIFYPYSLLLVIFSRKFLLSL